MLRWIPPFHLKNSYIKFNYWTVFQLRNRLMSYSSVITCNWIALKYMCSSRNPPKSLPLSMKLSTACQKWRKEERSPAILSTHICEMCSLLSILPKSVIAKFICDGPVYLFYCCLFSDSLIIADCAASNSVPLLQKPVVYRELRAINTTIDYKQIYNEIQCNDINCLIFCYFCLHPTTWFCLKGLSSDPF